MLVAVPSSRITGNRGIGNSLHSSVLLNHRGYRLATEVSAGQSRAGPYKFGSDAMDLPLSAMTVVALYLTGRLGWFTVVNLETVLQQMLHLL